ncbi:MAG: sulfoxide reductase heme-binding subunit YedZ [Saprospiraceae bacterium]|jgi:sulfoxide reductase heme-binding subunit YedZ
MDESKTSGIWQWQIVRLILLVALILFAIFLGVEGFTEKGVRLVIRWSAKFSVTCFSIAFIASAFHRWQQNSFSFWVFMNRKYFGISFAILHLMHLAALGVLQYFFHPVFEKAATFSLIAGGMAYLFLVLMLLTSFERFSKLLSRKQWSLLHTIGGYWILAIFFSSYFKGVMRAEYWDLVFLVILILVLVFRAWKMWKGRTEETLGS